MKQNALRETPPEQPDSRLSEYVAAACEKLNLGSLIFLIFILSALVVGILIYAGSHSLDADVVRITQDGVR